MGSYGPLCSRGVAESFNSLEANVVQIRRNSLAQMSAWNQMEPPLPIDQLNQMITNLTAMERRAINAEYDDYDDEAFGNFWFGRSSLADLSPISNVPLGQSALLTFAAVDPRTGLPVQGVSIGSVSYMVNEDPDNPDVLVPIGTSTDASAGFAVSYTVSGFEPMIFAVPYDLQGNAIVMAGVDGVNVAPAIVVDIPVPEPSAMKLAVAIAGIITFRIRRAMRHGP